MYHENQQQHFTSYNYICLLNLVPPKFVLPLSDQSVLRLNQSGDLVAQIAAKPLAKLKWLKDNKELLVKDGLKFESSPVPGTQNTLEYKLNFANVQAADAGVYKLEAANKCGSAISQTHCVVSGNN